MIIYIVNGVWDYEGSVIEGVFASRKLARRKAKRIEKRYDWVNVVQRKVRE